MKQIEPTVKTSLESGLGARERGDLLQAKSSFQAALAEARRTNDTRGEASALLYLSNILRRYDKETTLARQQIARCLELFTEIQFQLGTAYALLEYGTIDYEEGNFDDALAQFSRALPLFSSQGNQNGHAMVLHQIGLVEKAKGNYVLAEKSFRDAMTLFQAIGNQNGIGQVLISLSDVQFNYNHDRDGAMDLLHQALAIFENHGTSLDIQRTKSTIASLEKFTE